MSVIAAVQENQLLGKDPTLVDQAWCELRDCVHARQFQKAASLLVSNPSLVSLKNHRGQTVLHDRAIDNDLESVAWLHAHGFDLDAHNGLGIPMVFEVAALGQKELLLWLKQAGANFRAVDGKGRSLVVYLRECNTAKASGMIDFVGALFVPDS